MVHFLGWRRFYDDQRSVSNMSPLNLPIDIVSKCDEIDKIHDVDATVKWAVDLDYSLSLLYIALRRHLDKHQNIPVIRFRNCANLRLSTPYHDNRYELVYDAIFI